MPRPSKFANKDIVEAGLAILQNSGWEGLTPKSVANELGASTMPIFSHFPTMDDFRNTLLNQAWDNVLKYVSKKYTGDTWVDQAIGYILFARDHGKLFSCMHYGPVEDIRERRYRFWINITKELETHHLFRDLDPLHAGWIRHIRSLLTHGIAVSVSSGLTPYWEDEMIIRQMMILCSEILYEGFTTRKDRLDTILQNINADFKKKISGKKRDV